MAKFTMPKLYCGPGCAMCCGVLSVWGILQLGVIGIFFMLGNPGLYHDFEPGTGSQVAMNCWIGAGLYVVCLLLSIYSMFMNKRAEKQAALDKAAEED